MVTIFVQEIIDGWTAADASNPNIEVRGLPTREAAIGSFVALFPQGTEFEIQDMILGIRIGTPQAATNVRSGWQKHQDLLGGPADPSNRNF